VQRVEGGDIAELDCVVPDDQPWSPCEMTPADDSRSSMEVTGIQDGPLASLTGCHFDLRDSTGRRTLFVSDLLSLFRLFWLGRKTGRSGDFVFCSRVEGSLTCAGR